MSDQTTPANQIAETMPEYGYESDFRHLGKSIRGRKFTTEMWDERCRLALMMIRTGASVRTCGKRLKCNAGTLGEKLEGPRFQSQYARACADRATALAEEGLRIVDDVAGDPDPRSRQIRAGYRQWFAARLDPKRYGGNTPAEDERAGLNKALQEIGRDTLLAQLVQIGSAAAAFQAGQVVAVQGPAHPVDKSADADIKP